MKYKCLVLDHDDTVVNSTETVHYPAFSKSLSVLRPEIKISLEDHIKYNFDPGFSDYCYKILGFTEEEMRFQVDNWNEYVKKHIPKAYPGISEVIKRQKEEGGYVCVVSHSMKDNILRDYRENGLPLPDAVFGWERPAAERKPSPFPLFEIMKTFSLSPKEMLVVDDLLPGKKMADAAETDFAAAGWSRFVPGISERMKEECKVYLPTVKSLYDLLFRDP